MNTAANASESTVVETSTVAGAAPAPTVLHRKQMQQPFGEALCAAATQHLQELGLPATAENITRVLQASMEKVNKALRPQPPVPAVDFDASALIVPAMLAVAEATGVTFDHDHRGRLFRVAKNVSADLFATEAEASKPVASESSESPSHVVAPVSEVGSSDDGADEDEILDEDDDVPGA